MDGVTDGFAVTFDFLAGDPGGEVIDVVNADALVFCEGGFG